MNSKKKPELLVTAKNLDELKLLVDAGADAINIGGEPYGLRVAGNFSLDMIKEGINIAHKKQAKVYILMNALLHNELLTGLTDYIKKLVEYNVDAIVYGDPAVLVTAKEIALELPLHLNTETTLTSYGTINYWATKGATRAVLARELSFEEVIQIKQKIDIEVQAQVHGMTCIFHSKRSLITDYLEHTDNNHEEYLSEEHRLFLREHKRPSEQYPVFEDIHGTHIMSDQDICMIDHIDKFIESGIDSLKIEGIMHSTDYLVKITKLYRQAIDSAFKNEEISNILDQVKTIQPNNRPLGAGFYFKEQIY